MVRQRDTYRETDIDGILPKGPYPPCLRMADRALLAGYPRYVDAIFTLDQMIGTISNNIRYT